MDLKTLDSIIDRMFEVERNRPPSYPTFFVNPKWYKHLQEKYDEGDFEHDCPICEAMMELYIHDRRLIKD